MSLLGSFTSSQHTINTDMGLQTIASRDQEVRTFLGYSIVHQHGEGRPEQFRFMRRHREGVLGLRLQC